MLQLNPKFYSMREIYQSLKLQPVSNVRWSFGQSRYQYSVLNTSLMEHYDESNDPLMNDIGRDDENGDNFLDISRYQYSDDDDVELLGVS